MIINLYKNTTQADIVDGATQSIDELLSRLYLKGVSTGDYQDAPLGDQAKGLSANIISQFKRYSIRKDLKRALDHFDSPCTGTWFCQRMTRLSLQGISTNS